MAASCKTTTSSTTTASTDSIAQQMDSTRMTTATVSHHNQQNKKKHQQCAQSSDNDNDNIATLHMLLDLPANMELSQIELIYRAEGNANLVLALPQFKKVLRLPKSAVAATSTANPTTSINTVTKEENPPVESSDCNLKSPQAQSELLEKQKPHKQAQKASVITQRESQSRDDLTMKDFATYMQILRQLLGAAYVLDAEICWIHQETDRKWINKHISTARPAHRLDKEFCGQFGLLLPDATRLPSIQADILHSNLQPEAKVNENTYAIEIKPKQGWQLFPNPDASSSSQSIKSSITTSHLDIKDLFGIRADPTPSTPTATKVPRTTVARCRYCAMQFLKLKNHKISHMNTYCPIELFSGTPSRMLIALDALFRCPQNNLRVFKNGILIYGDHASSISYEELREEVFSGDTFQVVKNLLVECLLREYDESSKSNESTEITETLTGVTGVIGQPHSSVTLPKKSSDHRMQTFPEPETKAPCEQQAQETQAVKVKTSTTTKTTLYSETAETTTKTSVPIQVQRSHAEILRLPKNCILQKILHLQLLVKHNLSAMHDADYENHKQRSYNALRSLLKHEVSQDLIISQPNEQYLLGATALDCSIMITFREMLLKSEQTYGQNVVTLADHKRSFLTKATVLDLDPKPDSHFSKYVQQTREAYEECAKS